MSSASVSSGVCVVRPSSVVYVILVFRPYVSWKTSSHVEMVHLWIISSLKHVVCWFRRGDDPPSINERRRRHVLRGVFAFMTHFAPLFDVCLFFIHPPCLFSQPLCVCVFVPYWPCCVIYGSMAWRLMLMLWWSDADVFSFPWSFSKGKFSQTGVRYTETKPPERPSPHDP